jgi:hypothetical protein
MARPNGSGQSIGANNAIAPLRNANFPSSVISPICSTFEPPSRGWTFASKILDIDLIHHRGMTDDGDGFTLAARLHAQNAEAVIFVMKCHTLDEAG